MKAIILAAGRGGRLRGVVGDRPKCLARIGDRTLIERQIRALTAHGISDVTVVAGFRTDEVRRACGPNVRILPNAQWASTNSLYSLWLARHALTGGFLVINCDVLFHPQLLADLLTARCEDALLVCARGDSGPYSAEEMKVHVRRGIVIGIAKTIADGDSDAENVGIAKFGPAGAAVLAGCLDRLVGDGLVREWLPRAFAEFCRVRPLRVVESRGYPWIEIDFPEDYWRACAEVLPAIEDSEPCTSASTTYVNARSR
jgi:choline kinase